MFTTTVHYVCIYGSAKSIWHPCPLCSTWQTVALWSWGDHPTMSQQQFIQPFYAIHRDIMRKLIWNPLWEPVWVHHKVPYWVASFLIYMNDISNSSNLFKCILFADYTYLFNSIEYKLPVDISNVKELLNNELANIHECLTVSRFLLSLTKTECIIFHPIQENISSHISIIMINGIQKENVHNFNFLWPLLLTWFNFNPSMDK